MKRNIKISLISLAIAFVSFFVNWGLIDLIHELIGCDCGGTPDNPVFCGCVDQVRFYEGSRIFIWIIPIVVLVISFLILKKKMNR
jgi:hypothetical protein